MTIDQILGVLLVLAVLFRYHRNELNKAEERFEKCDKERVLLHNLYYQRLGADFAKGGATPEELIEREPETTESRMKADIQRKKLELKSIARRNPSGLGRALRRLDLQHRPKLSQIRPSLDSDSAKAAEEQASRFFSTVEQKVKNARPTHSGG